MHPDDFDELGEEEKNTSTDAPDVAKWLICGNWTMFYSMKPITSSARTFISGAIGYAEFCSREFKLAILQCFHTKFPL